MKRRKSYRPLRGEALEPRLNLAYLVDLVTDEDDGDYTTGDLSLREAIRLANETAGFDVIEFDTAGAFSGSQTLFLAGSELPITDSVNIIGPGTGYLSIDANHLSRIFRIDDGNNSNLIDVELYAMWLTLGQASDDSGGAILSLENLFLHESVVTESSAANGGGIFNDFGTLTITNSTISNNISDSSVVLADGGGILNGGNGTLLISNSTIFGNESRSATGDAGGIDNLLGGMVILSNCTISNNSAAENGGGIGNTGTMIIEGSTIDHNSAGFGGGIGSDGTITITNSTISNNFAGHGGGGIALETNPGASSTIRNSTVFGNFAYTGGGIFSVNQGTTSLQNSIVAKNDAATLARDFASQNVGTLNVSFNLIGDNAGSGLVEAQPSTPDANGNLVGDATGNGLIDPLLGRLTFHGGLSLTHALLPGSPAIDRGLNANATGLTTDQRGLTRIFGGTVDMGAVEINSPASLQVDLATDEDDGNYAQGDLSLREAIRLANENPSADTITFANDITTNLLTLGTLNLTDEAQTTITGNGVIVERIIATHDFRIFHIDASFQAELQGLSIRNGNSIIGGGIFNSGTLTVTDSSISGNTASYQGGGIYNLGDLTVANSTLSVNTANFGGGIYNDGVLAVTNSTLTENTARYYGGSIDNVDGSLTVTDSTISENSALQESGGGISNSDNLTITNSTITGNSAARAGGGVRNNLAGKLTIINSTISGNSAGYNGGGISTDSGMAITNSTISGNSADFGGGGIESGNTLTVTNSTISGNSAGDFGGGISIFGILTVTNSTLSGNMTNGSGGGVINEGGPTTLINTTLTKNRADSDGDNPNSDIGGGIWTKDERFTFTTLHNSIVAGNFIGTGTTASDLAEKNVESSSSNNLIGDAATAGGLTNGINGNLVGDNGIGIRDILTILNPTLADNGGATLTHALVFGSPALNAGSNANIPVEVTSDQRGPGFARILEGTVDIGAVEQSFAPRITSNLTSPTSEQPITFTINLTGSPLPTGTVTLYVNNVAGVPASLIAGQVQITLNGLPVGLHEIFARYSGDANYAAADSAVLNQRVYSPSDLNRSNAIDITDVLIAVFYFNTYPNQPPIAVGSLPAGPPFVDSSGDGVFDIKDLLRVVFDYNQALANPEGESAALPLPSSPALAPTLSSPLSADAVLADDIDWLWPELLTTKRRRS